MDLFDFSTSGDGTVDNSCLRTSLPTFALLAEASVGGDSDFPTASPVDNLAWFRVS
jgi:hypothetical protein